jgi:hypothetical protein
VDRSRLIFLVDRNAGGQRRRATFRAGAACSSRCHDRGASLREFDVTRDGQTFVFVGGSGERIRNEVDVVLDWASELARQPPWGK